mmetsp:Transcript_45556/g.114632  ORF Transcript_45556/g.114632 Transcript_45556/m.114632 type:complete len:208 (+) Transcript_45556:116-739(+)
MPPCAPHSIQWDSCKLGGRRVSVADGLHLIVNSSDTGPAAGVGRPARLDQGTQQRGALAWEGGAQAVQHCRPHLVPAPGAAATRTASFLAACLPPHQRTVARAVGSGPVSAGRSCLPRGGSGGSSRPVVRILLAPFKGGFQEDHFGKGHSKGIHIPAGTRFIRPQLLRRAVAPRILACSTHGEVIERKAGHGGFVLLQGADLDVGGG